MFTKTAFLLGIFLFLYDTVFQFYVKLYFVRFLKIFYSIVSNLYRMALIHEKKIQYIYL